MSTKKIQYNPNILSSMKTKSKTQRINRPLLINQNSLKNQLISRVKNHKKNDNEKNKNKNEIIISNKSDQSTNNAFTDEFNDSINYLSQLSKKQKVMNKTIKQPYQPTIPESQIMVDLELPNELKEIIPQATASFTPTTAFVPSIPISYNIDTQVPYGCLKNGLKPTYKQFTRRNLPSIPILNERENKLNMIKHGTN